MKASKDKKKKPETKKGKKESKESLVEKLDKEDSLLGSLMVENYKELSKVKKKKKY
jgi:hypothetical protein